MVAEFTREQIIEQADMLGRDGYGNASRMLRAYAETLSRVEPAAHRAGVIRSRDPLLTMAEASDI